MMWLDEHQRIWRAAVLLIAVVAFDGPWAFEGVYVPPEARCLPPYIPWEGDYCGMPIAGGLIFLMPFRGFYELVRAVTLLEPDPALQMLPMLLAVTLTLLPLFTTFYLIVSRGRSFRFQTMAWGLAALAGPYLARTYISSLHSAAWGLWLYVGLAVGALALELAAFVADGRPDVAQIAGQ